MQNSQSRLPSLIGRPTRERSPEEMYELNVILSEQCRHLDTIEADLNCASDSQSTLMLWYHLQDYGNGAKVSLVVLVIAACICRGSPGNIVMMAYTLCDLFHKQTDGKMLTTQHPEFLHMLKNPPSDQAFKDMWEDQKYGNTNSNTLDNYLTWPGRNKS